MGNAIGWNEQTITSAAEWQTVSQPVKSQPKWNVHPYVPDNYAC